MKRLPSLVWILCTLGAAAPGCVTQDDARVQTLLNQRGFGNRYVGDSNEQYYLGIGDSIVVNDVGHPELAGTYVVRMDGVIDVPLLGEIFVAGLTIPDVGETLTRRFREYISTAQVDVQLAGAASKVIYVEGEVGGRGPRPFTGNMTLFDVIFAAGPSITADEDAIRLIRADPVHPLIVKFDYDDMLTGGYSRGNVEVRENDIIYVPPNLVGHFTNFIQLLFTPIQEILVAVIQLDRLIYTFDTFSDDNRFRGGNNNNNRGRRFGGVGMGAQSQAAVAKPSEP